MKKCSVDLVTGFLSSGKTSFINVFLSKTLKKEETIVIQCEDGKEEISSVLLSKPNLSVKKFHSSSELTEERLIRMIKFYKPERMIIECNGIEDLNEVIVLFNTNKLKSYFKISGVISVLNALTFNMFFKNLAHIVLPYIEKSDLIILNQSSQVSDDVLDKHLNVIKNLNTHAHILVAYDKENLEMQVKKAKVINA